MPRAVGAAALALATCIGALCAVPTAAAAAPPPGGEATVASPPSTSEPYLVLRGAGKGVLLSDRNTRGSLSWWSADGRQVPVECGVLAWLGDEVACDGTTELKIRDHATGATESVPRRENRAWAAAFSPTQVLAHEKDADGRYVLHLLGRANEPRKDVPVTGAGALGSYAVLASDARGALVEYWGAGPEGKHRHGLLDYATATLKELPEVSGGGATYNHVGLGSKWIAMVSSNEAVMVSRTDPAVVRTVAIGAYPERVLTVGDWLIADTGDRDDPVVTAHPVDGGAPRPVLDRLDGQLVLGADGGAYGLSTVKGSTRWAVHRISADAQGALRVQEALAVPARPADRRTIAIAQGDLSALHVDNTEFVLGYRTSVTGPPSITEAPAWRCERSTSDPLCPEAAGRFGGNAATGDGRIVGMSADPAGCATPCSVTVHIRDARNGGSQRAVKLPGALRNPRIVSSSGRYLLVGAETDGVPRQLVLDIDAGKVSDVKPAPAAGLWGSLLWQPEGDKGVVAATDLRTGQVVRRVDLGSACRPYELQANGDWFYSTCAADGTGAAAHHVPTRQRIPLPFVAERPLGQVRLGDGYVVQDNAGLTIYNLRSGQAVKEYQVQQYVAGYGLDWSVDRFGGRPAHLDQGETIHVVGVTGATSPLAVIDQNVPGTLDAKKAGSRQARWWLSKPVSSWKLMARNKASGIATVVRSGGEARGAIDLVWDGKDQAGRTVMSGAYEWTLLAVPADGHGAPLKATGSVTLTGTGFQAGRGRP